MRYLLKVTLMMMNCFGMLAQTAPSASIITTSKLQCTGIPITFSAAVNQSALSYTWNVQQTRGLESFSDLNSNTLSLTFTVNLTYTISLIVANSTGTYSTSTIVAPSKTPKASFNASMDGPGFPSNLYLTNYSSNQIANKWLYNDVSAADSSYNAVKKYNAPGLYNVTLVAKGLRGCNDTSRYYFEIPGSSSIILPNIFTPNNDDVNEVYTPVVSGISTLKASVYNRYGALMTSWDKVHGSWDGYTNSGVACDEGQYFIYLEATGFDGKVYKLKSAITLAR